MIQLEPVPMSCEWSNSILRNHGAVNLEQSDVEMCSQPQQLFKADFPLKDESV